MTELFVLFQRAAEGFGTRVHSLGERQWHDPTPCTDWDVRMLVNHVTVEQLWVPPLLEGSSVADVGDQFDGDQLGDDPKATWDRAMTASLSAFGAAGALERTVSLSSGEKASAEYCWEMTTDALIHSWDLARGSGSDETLDAELVDLVYARTLPVAEHLHETGLFAPPVPVPEDASLQTKLLAIFGRRA
ncbi:MAG: TIGR03086 family metal-binding protein [Acidimicrobiia bacterium]